MITREIVAAQIERYLHGDLALAALVDWAERTMMEEEFDERDLEAVRDAVARLGVADVREFGLAWEDCRELLALLGYAVKVDVVVA